MARQIDLDQLMKYPLRRGSEHCDEKNADPRFLNGVESILEWAQTLPTLTPPNELLTLDQLRELAQADREGRCVVLNMPRKPLVWGDGDKNTCLCPYCGKDLMGIPYGERMVLQCPECGQYLDATKVITRAEDTLREDTNG